MTNKQYLGDSVYAAVDNGFVVLTTDNGLGATNVIYLEPDVIAALERYLSALRAPRTESGQ